MKPVGVVAGIKEQFLNRLRPSDIRGSSAITLQVVSNQTKWYQSTKISNYEILKLVEM
jgi:hypothetical protein